MTIYTMDYETLVKAKARKNKNWRFEYMTYQQEMEHEKFMSFKEGEAKTLDTIGVSKEQYKKILSGELKIELKAANSAESEEK